MQTRAVGVGFLPLWQRFQLINCRVRDVGKDLLCHLMMIHTHTHTQYRAFTTAAAKETSDRLESNWLGALRR